MIFRGMTVEDLPALMTLQEEGAVAALSHIFPQDRYPFPRDQVCEGWRAEIADPGITPYVSTDSGGELTGFSAVRAHELVHFGTARATWGSGLARELHDATLATMP